MTTRVAFRRPRENPEYKEFYGEFEPAPVKRYREHSPSPNLPLSYRIPSPPPSPIALLPPPSPPPLPLPRSPPVAMSMRKRIRAGGMEPEMKEEQRRQDRFDYLLQQFSASLGNQQHFTRHQVEQIMREVLYQADEACGAMENERLDEQYRQFLQFNQDYLYKQRRPNSNSDLYS